MSGNEPAPVVPESTKTASPLPWHYQEESDAYTHIIRDFNGGMVAQLSQDTSGKTETNARLIVEAVNSLPASSLVATPSCDQCKEIAADCYQLAGMMNAPIRVLDSLSGVVSGEPFVEFLPVSPDEIGTFPSESVVAKPEPAKNEGSRLRIQNLLEELDSISRGVDVYDYGLPLHDEEANARMFAAVESYLRIAEPSLRLKVFESVAPDKLPELLEAVQDLLDFQPEYSKSCAAYGRTERLKELMKSLAKEQEKE